MDFVEEFELSINLFRDIYGDGNIINAVNSADKDDIYEFTETLYLISKYHFKFENKPNENFSFVANSSLSGGRFPCSHPRCRTQKLESLISFSSLYADEVYVQNPFEKIVLNGSNAFNENSRTELIHGIFNYFQLKPLIEKGIVKYAQNRVSLCKNHYETIALPLEAQINNKLEQLYTHLHDYLIERCTIFLDDLDDGSKFFKITGPDGLIEHGEVYLYLTEPLNDCFKGPMSNFFTSIDNKCLPYKLSKAEIINESILEIVINPILDDLSNQEWHSAFYGTSYLFDNPTQIKIASKINNATYAANSLSFTKAMNHHLPLVFSNDLNTVVQLREQESEAFKVYRDKINTLIRQKDLWKEKDISEIFRDQVLPEINMIEKKVKDWQTKTRESIKDKILFGSGAVSIGLYSGTLPTSIGQFVAAIGGASVITSALMDYNKTLKEQIEARGNDYYFLWQAKK
mgnify:CR=1 FL=1